MRRTAQCRWRCVSKETRIDGRWVIVLSPVSPRHLPPEEMPTGRPWLGPHAIVPPSSFEFATWAPDLWEVGKMYEMTIRRATSRRKQN